MCFTDLHNVGIGDHGGQQPGPAEEDERQPAAGGVGSLRRAFPRTSSSTWTALYICMGTESFVGAAPHGAGRAPVRPADPVERRFVIGRPTTSDPTSRLAAGAGAHRHWKVATATRVTCSTIARLDSPLHPTMKPPRSSSARKTAAVRATSWRTISLGKFADRLQGTGRTCYGMELKPDYCAVALARWENFTGLQAAREA